MWGRCSSSRRPRHGTWRINPCGGNNLADELVGRTARVVAPAMDLATVDHLLTTTRVVRRRLDTSRPIACAVLERCVEIALQAPTGSNAQGWHFVVVA